MRAAADARSIGQVMSTPPPTLMLELERADGDQIAGRLSTTAGTAIAFVGWLGLAGAIETALREEGQPAGAPESTAGGSAP